jgi:hypothetical protein
MVRDGHAASSPADQVQQVLAEILERLDLLEARMDAIHGATGRSDEVSSLADERRRAEIRRRPQ